jgi:hypothetical protein
MGFRLLSGILAFVGTRILSMHFLPGLPTGNIPGISLNLRPVTPDLQDR